MHRQGHHDRQLESQAGGGGRQRGHPDQAAGLDILRNHQVRQCAVLAHLLDPRHAQVRHVGDGPRAGHAHLEGRLGDDLHRVQQGDGPGDQDQLQVRPQDRRHYQEELQVRQLQRLCVDLGIDRPGRLHLEVLQLQNIRAGHRQGEEVDAVRGHRNHGQMKLMCIFMTITTQ